MKKPEIVSMIKINGKWVNQKDIPPEELKKIVEKKMDEAMARIGFERVRN